jgi:lipopolysaccharide transport system permease protein
MSKPLYTDTQQRLIRRVIPELVRARELLIDLIWKDVRVRYRYALMGFVWAVLEPLLMTLILTFVFSLVFQAKVERLGIETGQGYAVFILAALIPWQFLAASLTTSTRSLVDNSNLVQKVYFPREIIPLAAVGNALVNFFIGYLVLLVFFTALVGIPGFGALWLLAVFLIQLALVAGLALILSCAHVFFRDVGHIIDVAVLFGFYATPIFYPPEFVRDRFEALYPFYMLNPMAGLVTAYRDLLWFNTLRQPSMLIVPLVSAVLALAVGTWLFRRNAPFLSDNL